MPELVTDNVYPMRVDVVTEVVAAERDAVGEGSRGANVHGPEFPADRVAVVDTACRGTIDGGNRRFVGVVGYRPARRSGVADVDEIELPGDVAAWRNYAVAVGIGVAGDRGHQRELSSCADC